MAIERRWIPGLVALLTANVVPLVGVVAFQWDLATILLLYWAESAVVLLFSLVKVAMIAGRSALGLIPFFLVHAGMFMGAHLLFLVVVFVSWPTGEALRQIGTGVLVLFASHAISFTLNVVRAGERPASTQSAMTGFYARIVILHVTIIFGAFLLAALGSPTWALALLVAIKTGVDVRAHLRERRRPSEAAAEVPVESVAV